MRHVSRTHMVALDWLFDRINLDQQIQVKYVDTRSQLADVLTKGTFTRGEWNHLLQLFNVVDASLFSRSHFSFRVGERSAMSKQGTEEGEETSRVVAKSRSARNLVAFAPEGSLPAVLVPDQFLFYKARGNLAHVAQDRILKAQGNLAQRF